MTRSGSLPQRWLRGADPSADLPRIVCCPHSGGSAAYFRAWQAAAPAGVAVLAVQYPGRHDRLTEPFAAGVPEIADRVAAELSGHRHPTVLFGHSMGASVAFEVARRLRAAGDPVAELIVSAHTPPMVRIDSDLHLLGEDDMWQALAEMGGTEPDILGMRELREIYTPIVRADLSISTAYYDPGSAGSLDVPVTAVAGTRDAVAPSDDMLRWAEVTSREFALHTFDGDHFYLQDHVPAIVRLACRRLPVGATAGGTTGSRKI